MSTKYIILHTSNPRTQFDINDLECVSCEWEVYDTFSSLERAQERLKLLRPTDGSVTQFVLLQRTYEVVE
jgi:hypothetical protein